MSADDRALDPATRVAPRGLGSVRAALGLLTRFPVRGQTAVETTGAAAFGLVGALVGASGGLAMVLLGAAVPTLAAVVAVGVMAVVSGGLHLDGLADTADALSAPDATRAEAARKDPAIGSGGAVALIVVLGAQVAGLATVAGAAGGIMAGLACVAAGAASRALPVVLVRLPPSRTSRGGLAAWFAERVSVGDAIAAILSVAAISAVAGGLAGSVALPIAVAVGSGLGLAAAVGLIRARGQLDGDGMGATVELGFGAIVAVLAVLLSGSWPIR